MGPELRDQGNEPFKKGEIDLDVLKRYLVLKRRIDEVVLNALGLSAQQLDFLKEKHAVDAFNELLEQQSLANYVEITGLKLRPDIEKLMSAVHEATTYGKAVKKEAVRKLNRALLFSVYIQDTAKLRKYERFSSASFLKTSVSLEPLHPYFGNTLNGILVNLSAGGMALILKERVRPGTRMTLKALFHDKTSLENEVEIKHAISGNKQYVHGFEFIDLPNFRLDKFKRMAKDFKDCETRIGKSEKEICRLDCSFYTLCNKPEKK